MAELRAVQFELETEAGGFHLVATAYGSGRVPHFRQSVHPDFLSSFLALTNFMRLSLMKAAHASVGGAPCRKSGTLGRKRRGAAPSSASDRWAIYRGQGQESSCNKVKAFEKSIFGPCTLWRTWGTRPENRVLFFALTSAPPTNCTRLRRWGRCCRPVIARRIV